MSIEHLPINSPERKALFVRHRLAGCSDREAREKVLIDLVGRRIPVSWSLRLDRQNVALFLNDVVRMGDSRLFRWQHSIQSQAFHRGMPVIYYEVDEWSDFDWKEIEEDVRAIHRQLAPLPEIYEAEVHRDSGATYVTHYRLEMIFSPT